MINKYCQQGVALITALVITSIAVTIAATLVYRQQLSIQLASNIGVLEQAYQYATGMEDWAGIILRNDLDDSADTDSCDDAWAETIPPIPIPGGIMEGKLYDLQALININNGVGNIDPDGKQPDNTVAIARFKGLLTQLKLLNQLELNDAVLDWVDKNDDDRTTLAESGYYNTLEKPYFAANALVAALSEVRMIKGFSEVITNGQGEEELVYKKVLPYISALPQNNIAINVNTAPAEVLSSITGISPQQANDAIEARKGGAFETLADFKSSVGGGNNASPIIDQGLDVRSSYFLLKGLVQMGKVRLFINSILYRDANSRRTVVIKREYNEVDSAEILDTCPATAADTGN